MHTQASLFRSFPQGLPWHRATMKSRVWTVVLDPIQWMTVKGQRSAPSVLLMSRLSGVFKWARECAVGISHFWHEGLSDRLFTVQTKRWLVGCFQIIQLHRLSPSSPCLKTISYPNFPPSRWFHSESSLRKKDYYLSVWINLKLHYYSINLWWNFFKNVNCIITPLISGKSIRPSDSYPHTCLNDVVSTAEF